MIQKSVLLHLPAGEAFDLFTRRISEWWPATHRLTKDPESQLFLEESGRFWERAGDGREIELGRVLTWERPHYLTLDFYVGTNAAQPTHVEITFLAEGADTRVNVNHRPTPDSEGLWTQRAPVFEKSWQAVLTALANR
jgi:hypothetical protein